MAAELEGVQVLSTIVHQRAAFERAEALGLAVTELDRLSEFRSEGGPVDSSASRRNLWRNH